MGVVAVGSDEPPAPIVEEIKRARTRQRLSYRVQFILTWIVLIVGLIFLLAGHRHGFDSAFVADWAVFILTGAGITIFISVVSIVFATLLAVLGALARLSSNPIINGVASLYVSLVRGTPLLVQILFTYLALAEVGLVLPALVAGISALAFNYGAYLTEVFRAGIQAVPKGQREAAQALGMPERLVLRRIVLPQAFRIVVPAIGNDFISMIKDSALVSIIAVQELLWRAQAAGRPNVRIFEALTFAALVYWVLTIVFSFFQDRLEKRLARGDR